MKHGCTRFIRHLPVIALLASTILPTSLAAQQASSSILQQDVQAIVRQLGLSDVEIHRKEHRGRDIEGRLPGGTRVEIELDRDGHVEEIEARGRDGFAARTVDVLIPAAVRNNAAYPADASFRKLEFHDGRRIEIEGYRADGRKFEAEFSRDGRLLEMKR